MANVTSQYAKSTRPTGQPSPYVYSGLALGRGAQTELRIKLDIKEDNLTANSQWEFLRVPADTLIEEIRLITDDLDANAVPTVTVLLKSDDGVADTTHLAANNVAQTGGTVAAGAALPRVGGVGPIRIYAQVGTAAATPQAGTATLIVRMTSLGQ